MASDFALESLFRRIIDPKTGFHLKDLCSYMFSKNEIFAEHVFAEHQIFQDQFLRPAETGFHDADTAKAVFHLSQVTPPFGAVKGASLFVIA